MTTGYLWYNADRERYGIIDEADLWTDDGLHCGACMEALLGFDWISVRLEYTQHDHELTRGWYFVGPGDKVYSLHHVNA